jgi:hypothetical protein
VNYIEALEQLTGRCSNGRKVGNNTCLERRENGAIALRLHSTDIITFGTDGATVLNSGGWRTVTTKDRLNRHLPDPWRVNSERGFWFLQRNGDSFPFADGVTINANGTVTGEGTAGKELQKLHKLAGKYAKDFIAALYAGEVPAPSGGDCWFCLMREEKSGRPLGELSGSDHVLSHVREGYFVPSLLVRAIERGGCSIAAKSTVGEIWNGRREEVTGDWPGNVVRGQLERVLRRYVRGEICRAA